MHVVEGIYAFQMGGAETLAAKLAIFLKRKNIQVSVVATHGGDGPISDLLRRNKIPCFALDSEHYNPIVRRWRIFCLFRRLKPTIFHAHHTTLFHYCYPAVTLACSPKSLVTEHTDFEMRHYDHYFKTARFAARRADLFSVVHSGMRRYLEETVHIDPKKLRVIENGVDVNQFNPTLDGQCFRAEISAGEKDILLGYVGRMHPQKNLTALIQCMPRRCSQNNAIRLVLAGDGPEKEALTALCDELGVADKVLFLGMRSDIPNVMSGLDVFVLPSLTEGSPLVLLEAMSTGLACVATSVGAVPEILSKDAGFTVEPSDSDALSAALIALADDRETRHKFGKRARRIIESSFSEQKCFDEYCRQFEQLSQSL
ncbi:MAG: glycosyltransferase [Gammaproteobacteria bacterium]